MRGFAVGNFILGDDGAHQCRAAGGLVNLHNLERGLAVGAAVMLALFAAVWLIRWARKGGRGASLMGGALLLMLGAGLVPEPPQQRIEEAREQRGKKGAESGDPPTPPGPRITRIRWRGFLRGRSSGRLSSSGTC